MANTLASLLIKLGIDVTELSSGGASAKRTLSEIGAAAAATGAQALPAAAALNNLAKAADTVAGSGGSTITLTRLAAAVQAIQAATAGAPGPMNAFAKAARDIGSSTGSGSALNAYARAIEAIANSSDNASGDLRGFAKAAGEVAAASGPSGLQAFARAMIEVAGTTSGATAELIAFARAAAAAAAAGEAGAASPAKFSAFAKAAAEAVRATKEGESASNGASDAMNQYAASAENAAQASQDLGAANMKAVNNLMAQAAMDQADRLRKMAAAEREVANEASGLVSILGQMEDLGLGEFATSEGFDLEGVISELYQIRDTGTGAIDDIRSSIVALRIEAGKTFPEFFDIMTSMDEEGKVYADVVEGDRVALAAFAAALDKVGAGSSEAAAEVKRLLDQLVQLEASGAVLPRLTGGPEDLGGLGAPLVPPKPPPLPGGLDIMGDVQKFLNQSEDMQSALDQIDDSAKNTGNDLLNMLGGVGGGLPNRFEESAAKAALLLKQLNLIAGAGQMSELKVQIDTIRTSLEALRTPGGIEGSSLFSVGNLQKMIDVLMDLNRGEITTADAAHRLNLIQANTAASTELLGLSAAQATPELLAASDALDTLSDGTNSVNARLAAFRTHVDILTSELASLAGATAMDQMHLEGMANFLSAVSESAAKAGPNIEHLEKLLSIANTAFGQMAAGAEKDKFSIGDMAAAGDEAIASMYRRIGWLRDFEGAEQAAGLAAEDLGDRIDNLAGPAMSASEATLALSERWFDLVEAFQEGQTTLADFQDGMRGILNAVDELSGTGSLSAIAGAMPNVLDQVAEVANGFDSVSSAASISVGQIEEWIAALSSMTGSSAKAEEGLEMIGMGLFAMKEEAQAAGGTIQNVNNMIGAMAETIALLQARMNQGLIPGQLDVQDVVDAIHAGEAALGAGFSALGGSSGPIAEINSQIEALHVRLGKLVDFEGPQEVNDKLFTLAENLKKIADVAARDIDLLPTLQAALEDMNAAVTQLESWDNMGMLSANIDPALATLDAAFASINAAMDNLAGLAGSVEGLGNEFNAMSESEMAAAQQAHDLLNRLYELTPASKQAAMAMSELMAKLESVAFGQLGSPGRPMPFGLDRAAVGVIDYLVKYGVALDDATEAAQNLKDINWTGNLPAMTAALDAMIKRVGEGKVGVAELRQVWADYAKGIAEAANLEAQIGMAPEQAFASISDIMSGAAANVAKFDGMLSDAAIEARGLMYNLGELDMLNDLPADTLEALRSQLAQIAQTGTAAEGVLESLHKQVVALIAESEEGAGSIMPRNFGMGGERLESFAQLTDEIEKAKAQAQQLVNILTNMDDLLGDEGGAEVIPPEIVPPELLAQLQQIAATGDASQAAMQRLGAEVDILGGKAFILSREGFNAAEGLAALNNAAAVAGQTGAYFDASVKWLLSDLGEMTPTTEAAAASIAKLKEELRLLSQGATTDISGNIVQVGETSFTAEMRLRGFTAAVNHLGAAQRAGALTDEVAAEAMQMFERAVFEAEDALLRLNAPAGRIVAYLAQLVDAGKMSAETFSNLKVVMLDAFSQVGLADLTGGFTPGDNQNQAMYEIAEAIDAATGALEGAGLAAQAWQQDMESTTHNEDLLTSLDAVATKALAAAEATKGLGAGAVQAAQDFNELKAALVPLELTKSQIMDISMALTSMHPAAALDQVLEGFQLDAAMVDQIKALSTDLVALGGYAQNSAGEARMLQAALEGVVGKSKQATAALDQLRAALAAFLAGKLPALDIGNITGMLDRIKAPSAPIGMGELGPIKAYLDSINAATVASGELGQSFVGARAAADAALTSERQKLADLLAQLQADRAAVEQLAAATAAAGGQASNAMIKYEGAAAAARQFGNARGAGGGGFGSGPPFSTWSGNAGGGAGGPGNPGGYGSGAGGGGSFGYGPGGGMGGRGGGIPPGGGMGGGAGFAGGWANYTGPSVTQINKVADALDHVSNRASFMQRTLSMAFAFSGGVAVTNVIAFISNALVGFNSRLEQAHIAFGTLLGDGAAGDKFIQEMQDFANFTPFDFAGVEDASQRFLAMGMSVDQILPSMTAIGDAVAALGGGKEKLDRVTLALGQMMTAGRVNAQDMRQLTEAGIPAWDILAKSIGKSVAETRKLAENGLIPAEQAVAVLLSGMENRFGGMMARQARTAQGAFSTIRDAAYETISGAVRPLFEAISQGMVMLADFFTSGGGKYVAPVIYAIGTAVAVALIPRLWGLAASASAASIAIGAFEVPILPLLIAVSALGLAWQENFGGMATALQPIVSALANAAESVVSFVMSSGLIVPAIEIVAAIITTKLVVSLVIALATMIANAIGAVTLAIAFGALGTAAAGAAVPMGALGGGLFFVAASAGALALPLAIAAAALVLFATNTDRIAQGVRVLQYHFLELDKSIYSIAVHIPLIGDAFKAGETKTQEAMDKLVADMAAAEGQIDARAKALADAGAKNPLADLGAQIRANTPKILTATDDLITQFGQSMSGVVEAARNAGGEAMSEMAKAILDRQQSPLEAIKTLHQMLANEMSPMALVARGVGILASEDLARGLASGDPAVHAAALALQKTTTEQLDVITNGAYSAGANTTNNVAQGLIDSKALQKLAQALKMIGTPIALMLDTIGGGTGAQDMLSKAFNMLQQGATHSAALANVWNSQWKPSANDVAAAMKGVNAELDKLNQNSAGSGALSSAFSAIQSAAEEFFAKVHQGALQAIEDANKQKNAILDVKAALIQGPVDAQQRALDFQRAKIQEWRLRQAVATAKGPAEQRDAILALNDFLAQQHIDQMQTEVDAQKKRLDGQKTANDDAANAAKAAENARYEMQRRDFERQLELLRRYLEKHPGEWQKTHGKIMQLLHSFGFSYKQAGNLLGGSFVAGLREQIQFAVDAAKELANAGGIGGLILPGPRLPPTQNTGGGGLGTGPQGPPPPPAPAIGPPNPDAVPTPYVPPPIGGGGGGPIPMAEGSWQILKDNLLATLHMDEMVAPREIAGLMRQLGMSRLGSQAGINADIGTPGRMDASRNLESRSEASGGWGGGGLTIKVGDEALAEITDRQLKQQSNVYSRRGTVRFRSQR